MPNNDVHKPKSINLILPFYPLKSRKNRAEIESSLLAGGEKYPYTVDMAEDISNNHGPDGELLEDVDNELKEPDMYVVILHNDHYTTMDFVVEVLTEVFQKSTPEATKIMMDVHKKGKGLVGTYPYDIAASKVAKVRQLAKQAEFPLQRSMERI